MRPARTVVLFLSLALGAVAGCGPAQPSPGNNVLLLIADDLGIDYLASYGITPDTPATPNIDALAARGVLFRNAYAPSVCSPARAALLTGRHPLRYGFGTLLEANNDSWELPLSEWTLPEALAQANPAYANAAVGKWHVSTRTSANSFRHPLASGFDSHAGSLANLRGGARGSYYSWEKLSDGALTRSTTYATTDTANDATARVEMLPSPWFLWVAFNAPHRPLHVPPTPLSGAAIDGPFDQFRASIEALDAEIGRILAAVSEDTTVIFLSDNGTPGDFVRAPFASGHSKGTLAESGVRVPLIIAGPNVHAPGTSSAALVQLVDVFATIADLAGLDPEALRDAEGEAVPIDGRSLVPLLREPASPGVREFVFQGLWSPNGPAPRTREEWMIRDATHKLTRRCPRADCVEKLYRFGSSVEPDLVEPDPVDPKAEDAVARDRLRRELERRLLEG